MIGRLYLIPVPLSEGAVSSLSPDISSILTNLKYIVAERAKTARRWIKLICPDVHLPSIHIFELDKHGDNPKLEAFLKSSDGNVGFMSEAGCPGIADPGAHTVSIAHRLGWKVIPLVGPSSIVQGLMVSGFSGQHFSFIGYLPQQKPALKKALKDVENTSQRDKSTIIFIETPYRNQSLLETILQTLKPMTRLCIARDINGSEEWSFSGTVQTWRKMKTPDLHKKPSVFLIAAYLDQ